jgi:hypothetical protein
MSSAIYPDCVEHSRLREFPVDDAQIRAAREPAKQLAPRLTKRKTAAAGAPML